MAVFRARRYSLDPQTADRMHREACGEMGTTPDSADYCSMCGQHWCSLRINKELRQAVEQQAHHPIG